MTELVRKAVLFFMTPECYDEYFINFNFFHGECLKATICKILGLVIVAGSLTVKVPQILKIIHNRSGEGISLTGTTLDLCAITAFFLYGYLKKFPFSAWGEGLFLTIQTAAIIGLILHYKKRTVQLILFIIVFSTSVFLFLAGIVPQSYLWVLQTINLPILILGKGTQALANYNSKGTGQLSAVTWWMQFGGATARVFTSAQETGDLALVLSFIVASLLNGIIVFQIYYYAKAGQKRGKGKGKSKGKKGD